MPITGVIETEVQASTEEQAGGVGPFFKKTRVRAPFRAPEFLARVLRAAQKAGIGSVAALFVGEEDLLGDLDDEEVAIDVAIERVEGSFFDDTSVFSAMLTHREGGLLHVISAEGTTEYDLGEPALVVLDTATPDEAEEAAPATEDWEEEDEGAPAPAEDDLLWEEEEAPDYVAQVETFLRRLLGEMDKELALLEPDLAVWEEEVADPTRLPLSRSGYLPTGGDYAGG
jgi:hypothetical protein